MSSLISDLISTGLIYPANQAQTKAPGTYIVLYQKKRHIYKVDSPLLYQDILKINYTFPFSWLAILKDQLLLNINYNIYIEIFLVNSYEIFWSWILHRFPLSFHTYTEGVYESSN